MHCGKIRNVDFLLIYIKIDIYQQKVNKIFSKKSIKSHNKASESKIGISLEKLTDKVNVVKNRRLKVNKIEDGLPITL